MRSEGFLFCLGVWGQDRVHFDLGNSVANDRARPRTTAHVRWGLVGRAWSVWRRAVVIGGESLVWVVLCRCDWWGEPGLCGVVPL